MPATVEIRFADLYSELDRGDGFTRVPLSALESTPDWQCVHVHGRIAIEIAGRSLPYLGYFGDDDVCVDTWLVELAAARRALTAGTTYVFDEGEQGQPAFRFDRHGDTVLVSITKSEISDGTAHPDWQEIACEYAEFCAAVDGFVEDLERTTRAALPTKWTRWWPLRPGSAGAT